MAAVPRSPRSWEASQRIPVMLRCRLLEGWHGSTRSHRNRPGNLPRQTDASRFALSSPVETILELLSSGMTPEEILGDYEDLEREDILAALAYAARVTQIKRIEPAVA